MRPGSDCHHRPFDLGWRSRLAEERFHASTVAIHEALNQTSIKNIFYSSPGTDHEWQTWRRSLHDFAPRLFRD